MAKAKKRSSRQPARDPVVDAPSIINERIGSGMTSKVRTKYSGDAAWERLSVILGSSGSFFGGLADTLRKFLRESGVPDPTEEGKYPNVSRVTADLAKKERATMTWYAAMILDELRKVDRHLARVAEAAGNLSKRGNRINKAKAEGFLHICKTHSHNAALAAYRAGVLNQEARGKFHFEEDWGHGKKYRAKQSDKGRKRGVQRHKEAEERWALLRNEIKKFREARPEISQASAISYFMRDPKLQKKHGLKGISYETIKSALRRG